MLIVIILYHPSRTISKATFAQDLRLNHGGFVLCVIDLHGRPPNFLSCLSMLA